MFGSISSFLDEIEPFIAQGLGETIVGSWVDGAASNAVHVPKPKKPGPPPILPDTRAASGFKPTIVEIPGLQKGIETLVTKQILEPEEYYSAARSAREQAFTITADITNSTRDKIKDVLTQNFAGSEADYSGFVKKVREEIDDLPISDRHLQLVYRAAANQAYSDGNDHVLNHPSVSGAFPFVHFWAVIDERTRHDHEALEHEGIEGTNIYFRDSDVWRRIRPPLGFNCRCSWAPCSIEGAAEEGIKFAQEWEKAIEKAEENDEFSGYEKDYMPKDVPVVPMPTVYIPPSWERLEV